MKIILPVLIIFGLFIGIGLNFYFADDSKFYQNNLDNLRVLPASEVNWQKLNPARGDKSPQAGTLWGDRLGEVSTGFLAKFVDGFSSPPHIHNATYRAVVIDGLIHNDDPAAKTMWMPVGSFWTQPKGEVHITSAQGDNSIALVEIDRGPYLVMPESEKFDSGERPINMVTDNVVWVNPPEFMLHNQNPQIAYLWGNVSQKNQNGTFLKLPAGFDGSVHIDADYFHAVVIQGELRHHDHKGSTLDPGSYFGSEGTYAHAFKTSDETVLYIRTLGRYRIYNKS